MFSPDEGIDVGRDDGTPVTEESKVALAFAGAIRKVEVKLRQRMTLNQCTAACCGKMIGYATGLAAAVIA